MFDLFYQGGPLFMGLLSIIFLIILVLAVINLLALIKGTSKNADQTGQKLNYIKSMGFLAFVVGLLGQLIGLFSAFQAIELGAVNVSPSLLAAGFKVSMITTIYGLIILAVSYIIWFVLSALTKPKIIT